MAVKPKLPRKPAVKKGVPPKLNPKQQLFVDEYLIDLNATQAAIRAGYSEKNADKIGSELLGKTRVNEAINEGLSKRQERTEITQDMVLNLWWDLANADVNEVVEYRRIACESCWADKPIQVEADPDCHSCHGEGKGKIHIHDSRKLKKVARRLYNGVQLSKDGIKVLMLDRDKALENVARHLGMFKEKLEITGKDGKDFMRDVKDMTEEEILNDLSEIRRRKVASGVAIKEASKIKPH